MLETNQLKKERQLIHEQLYSYKIPNRLIVSASFNQIYCMQRKGIDTIHGQYDFSLIEESARELADLVYSDTCPIAGGGVSSRFASNIQLSGSRSFRMGADGYIQHPEVSAMEGNEYDELIADPYAFIVEKVVPRLYEGFDPGKAVESMRNFKMADMAREFDSNTLSSFISKLVQEKGYYTPPKGANGFTAAPFDFIADQLRSFSAISVDIRRNQNKLIDACEAIYPLIFKLGLPANPSYLGLVNTPLHMPMFMREKDVEKLWLPTYKRLCEQYAALGIRINAFCESDWTRLYDMLLELPSGIQLRFEYGDIKQIKDKLGKKFIIGTNFPLSMVKYATKQECIDKAKEIMDDTMDGGGILFGFDKGNFTVNDINLENYAAILNTVRDYGIYQNSGQQGCVAPLNTENFELETTREDLIKSKYTFSWEEFKKNNPFAPEEVKDRFRKFDEETIKYYFRLLV